MTSASIMEMQSGGYVSSVSATKNNMASTAGVQVQFSDAMQYASAGQQDEDADAVRQSEVKTHAEKNAAQHGVRKEIRETKETTEKQEVSKERISDEVKAEEEAVVEEIAQELGVSEEEVRDAMEILGLSVLDLMSPGNMAILAAQLTGVQAVDVLTDEQMFAQITELTQSVQQSLSTVAEELGVSVEQLRGMIEEQMAVKASVEEEAGLQTEQNADLSATDLEAVAVQEDVVAQEEVPESEKESVYNVQDDGEDAAQDVTLKKNAETKQESGAKGNEKDASAMSGQSANVLTPGNENVAIKTEGEVFGGQFDLERTKEMIDQISDYVRLHHTEKISSMEIQLHPVELGTVNLQVVAKDGVVSAQLTVQDEAIRAALEGQMIQLRESLQAQGLKIDAVEVTVASHEFEENLDRHGRDAEEEAAREKKGSRRILDLNEIGQEELEELEMSDAERLQIEMMRMGGNRMNFRV